MADTTVVVTQIGAGTVTIEDGNPAVVSPTTVQPTVTVDAQTTTVQVVSDPAPSLTIEQATMPLTLTEESTDLVEVISAGPQGAPGASNFLTVHTYAVGGPIQVASGDTNFIPPFFFQKNANQTSVLKKVRHKINSGTSATVKLQKNGSDITGYTGITVTTSATDSGSTQALADGDVIQLVVTAVSGSPQNLTVTLVIEHTII